jgi:hypothetical protein
MEVSSPRRALSLRRFARDFEKAGASNEPKICLRIKPGTRLNSQWGSCTQPAGEEFA